MSRTFKITYGEGNTYTVTILFEADANAAFVKATIKAAQDLGEDYALVKVELVEEAS